MKKSIILAIALGFSGSIWAHDIGHEHEHVEGGWNTEAGFVSDENLEERLWNPRGKSQDAPSEATLMLIFELSSSVQKATRAEIGLRSVGLEASADGEIQAPSSSSVPSVPSASM